MAKSKSTPDKKNRKTTSKKKVGPKKKATAKKKNASPTARMNMITTVGAFSDSLVPITYVLVKSNEIELKRLYIGDTKIDLELDQDPNDPNRFATRGSKKYMCINDDEGLKVVLRADGNAGGGWSLEINRSGVALGDNPIEEFVDGQGHADHNSFHN